MIYTWYGATFPKKGRTPKRPSLKTTLGRKKTKKSEIRQISPKGCALWVHILERPFWGNEVLIHMFVPRQYHVLSINSTENIWKAVVPNFAKMHIFTYVFVPKSDCFGAIFQTMIGLWVFGVTSWDRNMILVAFWSLQNTKNTPQYVHPRGTNLASWSSKKCHFRPFSTKCCF